MKSKILIITIKVTTLVLSFIAGAIIGHTGQSIINKLED